MKNNLGKHFSFGALFKFALPTMVMMIFMAMYQMVDGVFVANFVGENALSALNIVFPIPSIVIAVAVMLATGGSAVVARNMGEGEQQLAHRNFSLIVCAGGVFGILIVVFGLVFIDPIIRGLGATDILYPYCYNYLFLMTLTAPLAVFQMIFQSFFVTAGKPNIGLAVTILVGVSNIVLDYVFIVLCNLGVAGAALGTAIGYSIPAIFGLCYFALDNRGTLHFAKPNLDLMVLVRTCANGASEMVGNLANAITTLLFNIIMLRYLGESGVAAITVVLYAQFLLTAGFIGFSSGVAPIFSYNYGLDNEKELHNVFKICMRCVLIGSLIIFVASLSLASPIIAVFVNRTSSLFPIVKRGYLLFAISYLFAGINIYSSAMFTAFSDGKVSAIISFLRTFLFLTTSLLLLPMAIGSDGIWLAVPLAELLTAFISVTYLYKKRKKYKYL